MIRYMYIVEDEQGKRTAHEGMRSAKFHAFQRKLTGKLWRVSVRNRPLRERPPVEVVPATASSTSTLSVSASRSDWRTFLFRRPPTSAIPLPIIGDVKCHLSAKHCRLNFPDQFVDLQLAPLELLK